MRRDAKRGDQTLRIPQKSALEASTESPDPVPSSRREERRGRETAVGGSLKQEALASYPSQSSSKPASALHRHAQILERVRTVCTIPRPRIPPSLPFMTHN